MGPQLPHRVHRNYQKLTRLRAALGPARADGFDRALAEAKLAASIGPLSSYLLQGSGKAPTPADRRDVMKAILALDVDTLIRRCADPAATSVTWS